MFKHNAIVLASLFTVSALPINTAVAAAQAAEVVSTLNDQSDLSITIYNGNLALVKDQRKIKLSSGVSQLAIRDVSGQMRPETALLKSLSDASSFTTYEQNFDFDLLTPEKLLQKYVGKTVTIIKTNPANGLESSETATVLAANNGIVLQIGDRIETSLSYVAGPFGRIVFNDIPETLRDRPTLTTQLNNKINAEQTFELSYLTTGLSWKSDYVAVLNSKKNTLDLSAWVTLTNTSGATYQNAKLQLIAGDVNRVNDNPHQLMAVRKNMAMLAEAPSPVAEEAIASYHLYTLDRPTTIAENQTKQVALLNVSGIPVRKELVLRGEEYYYQAQYGDLGNKLKVSAYIEFDNQDASKLGLPLPKGVMRVYQNDSQGNAQFVGEDKIDHTPKNATVRLKLGESFDISADKKQTDFKVLPKSNKNNQVYESVYEIRLSNAQKDKVVVSVQEPISGDWQIISENKPHQKANSQLAVWKIEVPAEGSTTLTYKVRVKY